MPLRTLQLGFRNCFLAIAGLLATVSMTHAQVVVEQNAPRPGEIATQQIGGAGYNWYSFHGSLRCRFNNAIVGVWIRKGTLVDFMQVECAPLQRDANGNVSWNSGQIYNGGWAGNRKGGYMGRYTLCPTGYVISGFKAIYSGNNDFLSDIRFMCNRIAGFGMYPSPMGLSQYFQIKTTNPRQWISWISDDATIQSYSMPNAFSLPKQVPDTINLAPPKQVKPQSECTDGGAAALSVAVGTDVTLLSGFRPVVQAFQMFCYGGSIDLTKANPYKGPFENGQ
jgi:hypothetical protein